MKTASVKLKTGPLSLHEGWLGLERLMLARHGPEMWACISQGMQSAFYMGAIAVLRSTQTPESLMAQCESGIGDAMSIRNLKLIDDPL